MIILKKLGPPDPPVHIAKVKSVGHGHYTVTYKGCAFLQGQTNFSWTWIRTPAQALVLALKKAWAVYEEKVQVGPSPALMAEIEALSTRHIPWSR